MKPPYTLEDIQSVLADAAAINQALYSELLDVDDRQKAVSSSCSIMGQAQALTGIERDYIVKAMEQLREMIDAERADRPTSESDICELAAAAEYKPVQ